MSLNDELTAFINEHRNTALIVIRKSSWFSVLDPMEIEEVINCGLWGVWEGYNPEKGSLPYFINTVISRYILRIIRKKMKYRSKEVQLTEFSYQPTPDVSEHFTNEEWASVQPIFENHSLTKSAEIRGLDRGQYRSLTKVIAKMRRE